MTTRSKLHLAIPSNNLHVYIYNLRVSYPKEGIDLTFIDILSCFRWPRLFPDLVSAFRYLHNNLFFASHAHVFEKVKVYNLPNGTQVLRAFSVQDFIFYNKDGITLIFLPYLQRHLIHTAMDVVDSATELCQGLDDPLGVYLNGDGDKRYIVGADMTAYLRTVTSSVFVDIGRDVIQSTVVPAASLRSLRMHISWVQSQNRRHVFTGRVTVPNI